MGATYRPEEQEPVADWTAARSDDPVPSGGAVGDLVVGDFFQPLAETNAEGPYAAVMMERMAIPRYGKPDDVAALVAFVAGPEAGSINGTGLTVDGGANA
jgi:NAD(P)-dependent dehydrogenase (short-subunit alcohol dehydrogenase family)